MKKRYIGILRKNKLKITPKREAILDFFLENRIYATPEEIWKKLKNNFEQLGLPTIYRNLEEFNQIGILTKIEGEENRFYYGLCEVENPDIHHHHIVCVKCHKVGTIKLCNFDEITERIEKTSGFKVIDHSVQIKGICKTCLRKH